MIQCNVLFSLHSTHHFTASFPLFKVITQDRPFLNQKTRNQRQIALRFSGFDLTTV